MSAVLSRSFPLAPASVDPRSQASESWPSVPGKILHSEIAEHTSRSGQGKTTKSDTDYEVKVRYSYEVQGRSLEGNRLRFASWSHDERSAASKELKRYPKGKEVTVYYDPENPENTTLIKGFERWFTQIVVPAIFLLFGSILGIFLIRSMWQNRVRHSPGT